MKEIQSSQYKKIADLKTFPSLQQQDGMMSTDKPDQTNLRMRKRKRKHKHRGPENDTKNLYQVNRTVPNVNMNDIRE